eukprot:6199190-Pleurochrysis_carterae.AAC.4
MEKPKVRAGRNTLKYEEVLRSRRIERGNRRGGARPTIDFELVVATTTVVRNSECSVWKGSLLIRTRPATSKAHEHTVMREAESPLDQGVAMHIRVSTEEREGTAQRRINANATTCK